MLSIHCECKRVSVFGVKMNFNVVDRRKEGMESDESDGIAFDIFRSVHELSLEIGSVRTLCASRRRSWFKLF
jgi:hypothetical protein